MTKKERMSGLKKEIDEEVAYIVGASYDTLLPLEGHALVRQHPLGEVHHSIALGLRTQQINRPNR